METGGYHESVEAHYYTEPFDIQEDLENYVNQRCDFIKQTEEVGSFKVKNKRAYDCDHSLVLKFLLVFILWAFNTDKREDFPISQNIHQNICQI